MERKEEERICPFGNGHLGVKLIILSHTNMNYSVVVGRQWVYGK